MWELLIGEDSLALDEYYRQKKQQYPSSEELSLTNPLWVEERLATTSLFDDGKLYVLNNIFLNQVRVGKVSASLSATIEVLNRYTDRDLLMIETDPKKKKYYQASFPKIKVQEFKSNSVLFAYLDSWRPGNLVTAFGYWQQLQLTEAPELVFHLLKRRIRELLGVRTNSLKGNYQPWYLGKLKAQSLKFDQTKLNHLYQALFNFEVGQKSGQQPLTTAQALEIVMVSYL